VEVPAQMPFAGLEPVLEAVRGDQLDPAPRHHAEHDPARGRAEVDRRDGTGSRVVGRTVGDGAGGVDGRAARRGGPVGPRVLSRAGVHRRKAAATPASTGMWRPVVCERSPAVSANTALATFSGSTSRFSRVRWA